eukprot:5847185-Amphidinium_carterae.1
MSSEAQNENTKRSNQRVAASTPFRRQSKTTRSNNKKLTVATQLLGRTINSPRPPTIRAPRFAACRHTA